MAKNAFSSSNNPLCELLKLTSEFDIKSRNVTDRDAELRRLIRVSSMICGAKADIYQRDALDTKNAAMLRDLPKLRRAVLHASSDRKAVVKTAADALAAETGGSQQDTNQSILKDPSSKCDTSMRNDSTQTTVPTDFEKPHKQYNERLDKLTEKIKTTYQAYSRVREERQTARDGEAAAVARKESVEKEVEQAVGERDEARESSRKAAEALKTMTDLRDEAVAAKDALGKSLDTSTEEVADVQRRFREVDQAQIAVTTQRDEISQALSKTSSERDQVQGELLRVTGERDSVVKERDQAIEQRDNALKQRDEGHKQDKQTLEDITGQRDEALKTSETKDQIINGGTQKHDALQTRLSEAVQEQERLKSEFVTMSQTLDTTTKARDEAVEQRNKLQTVSCTFTQRLRAVNLEMEKTIKKHNDANESLSRITEELDRTKTALAGQAKAHTDAIKGVRNEEEIKARTQIEAIRERMNRELENVWDDIRGYRNTIDDLTTELREGRTREKHLRVGLLGLQHRFIVNDRITKEHMAMRRTQAEQNRRLTSSMHHQQVDSLKVRLSNATFQSDEDAAQLELCEMELERLREQFEKSTTHVDILTEYALKIEEGHQAYTADLEVKIINAEDQAKEAQENYDDLMKQYMALHQYDTDIYELNCKNEKRAQQSEARCKALDEDVKVGKASRARVEEEVKARIAVSDAMARIQCSRQYLDDVEVSMAVGASQMDQLEALLNTL
ncbi:uncharacterized protein LTR77_010952 [Saxophila tyrrhenica]|uniref:Uncharacterized protein n=1 Tax=Saxophila tyrrhenica TaxID=1690608 RepID=A0AAV9NUK3_9PEZI|nr:hypothetical protein LTR77_010952 [Saxophila tyrrhenica]